MKNRVIKMVQDSKVLTYEIGEGFRVDLQIENGVIRCHLYHTDYQNKMFVVGILEKDIDNLSEAMDIFINYIDTFHFISEYKVKYFDEYQI